MTEPLFEGVGVALVTLFNDDGSLDAKATADLACRLVEAGVRGVIVAGTTGEAASLDAAERAELVSVTREALAGAAPVLCGTGAASLRQALAFTDAALGAGAEAVLALSPAGSVGLERYYASLAERCGPVPLLAYHFPGASLPGIPLATLRELPVAGVKDSSGDAERLLETVTTWDQHVYTGSSALLSYAGPLGCRGAILALANAEPEGCVAAFAGDPAAQRAIAEAHKASRASFPRAIKELTARRFQTSQVSRIG
ncbi:MAG TPA: dihydrodipicolinate synthase family protein [Acidimicrobiales bacterium]|nr:dihydrodipicolinate synthase family protein [Acidimicrobiales bacterium]